MILLEQEKNLSKLKTVAFAQAAHEFRNPLSSISQSLELLKNEKVPEQREIYFQIAKSSSDLTLFLVNDILDFSQLESKAFIMNFEEVCVEVLSKSCLEILSFKAQSKRIEISCHIEQDVP